MSYFFAFLVAALAACPLRAADVQKSTATADSKTVELAEYFIKVPTAEANPKLVTPFLAIDTETLPKKMRRKAKAKQFEIQTLLKLHDTKKMGFLIRPMEGCAEKDFVLPLGQAATFLSMGYEEITEDELDFVKSKTKCEEIDLGCRFSMKLFFTKPKPRRLMFAASDPIMAIVAESRGKHGNTNFFGGPGFSCFR